jgi:uncharacterized protein (TIGR02145 family)
MKNFRFNFYQPSLPFLMLFLLFMAECTRNPEIVTDIDGNTYHTIKIGNQTWMVENLKVTRFNNGDSIPEVKDGSQWCHTEKPAYCNYNNDSAMGYEYGRLYNWFAVSDARKLAPEGWHIPTFAEVEELYNFLGGEVIAAGKMKEPGSKHWVYPNIWASNMSGFNALPGGYRFSNTASDIKEGGTFHTLGSNGCWWTTTLSFQIYGWSPRIYSGFVNVDRELRNKTFGLSLRCIKDRK